MERLRVFPRAWLRGVLAEIALGTDPVDADSDHDGNGAQALLSGKALPVDGGSKKRSWPVLP